MLWRFAVIYVFNYSMLIISLKFFINPQISWLIWKLFIYLRCVYVLMNIFFILLHMQSENYCSLYRLFFMLDTAWPLAVGQSLWCCSARPVHYVIHCYLWARARRLISDLYQTQGRRGRWDKNIWTVFKTHMNDI